MASKKVIVKVLNMNDSKTQQKAMAVVATFCGVISIEANLSSQKLTFVGEMDAVEVSKRLKKKLGKVEVISVT